MTERSGKDVTGRDEAQVLGAETGQGLAECGLIILLVAVVCVVPVTALGVSISGLLGGISSL